MNQQMYKNLRLGGALTICVGALALQLDGHVIAPIFLAVGILVFFSGVVGAWFNDG